ncbi:MAG: glycosyltransferase family 39 protein [Syntrophobacterales bacterium]|jgi:4-amino-4-deoxy-L-arabinose transferase-like glycosyltransferase|nr:glycosyltransferase family 39 protein [Syntrophobacterales bacterium]
MTIQATNRSDITYVIALLLLSCIFFFHGIGTYSLKEPDEGRYAEIPREMVELHDYVVPHLNYARYFEKPPLFYWATALSYKIFGTNEWSFRLPNALSALICVMALYFGARRWFGSDVAFLSSVILMSSFGFFAMARIVTLDMFFSLWLFLSVLCFYGYYREQKPLFVYLFFVAMGLSTLTKGPVSIILVGTTIFIFLLSEKNLSFLKEMKWIRGLAIYLIVTVPWIVAISLREKEFLYFFVVDQNILRFLTTKHKRTGSLFYFFPVLFGGMLPWSLFIPRSFVELWNKRELRLFLIWTMVVFGFFSISKSKLPPYILPVFPAISLVLGRFFHEKWKTRRPMPEIIAYILLFATLSSSALLYGNTVFTSYVGRISGEATGIMSELRGFSVGLSAVSAIAVVFLLLRRFNAFSFLFPLLTLLSGAIVIMLMLNSGTVDKLNTTKGLSIIVNSMKPAPAHIVNYLGFDETLPFYTGQKVLVAGYKGELEMGAAYEDSKTTFITETDFLRLLSSGTPIVAILKEKKLGRLRDIAGDTMKVIECRAKRCLVANY